MTGIAHESKFTNSDFATFTKAGWSIIPLCSPNGQGCHEHGKDCEKPGKRPLVRWSTYQRSIPSEVKINEWREKWPQANWAVITGSVSGICVLDVDKEENNLGKLGMPAICSTGRGQHFYFRAPDKRHDSVKVGNQFEFKAEGSYIVLPPSLHPTGKHYSWDISPLEIAYDFPKLPQSIIKRLNKPIQPKSAIKRLKKPIRRKTVAHPESVASLVRGVPEGQRNVSAARLIGKMVGTMHPRDWEEFIWPMAVLVNQNNLPPMKKDELRTIFDSICKRELSKAIRSKKNFKLTERVERELKKNPNVNPRELQRKLNGHRYGRDFWLVYQGLSP